MSELSSLHVGILIMKFFGVLSVYPCEDFNEHSPDTSENYIK